MTRTMTIVPAALSFLGAACVAQGDDSVAESQANITNGTYDPSDHQVVKVYPPGSSAACTGTFIGRRTILTAGHCLGGGGSPITVSGEAWVYDSTMGRGYWDPYTFQGTPVVQAASDVALVILPMNIPGVAPSRVASSVSPGLPITLVGFGQTGYGVGGGVRYLALNQIDSVDATQWYFSGVGGSEGATCFGDSGGPAYRTATDCIVGITRGEDPPVTCTNAGGAYIDTRVDPQLGWIQAHAPEAIASCTP
jgi:hypothetical protein